MAAAASDPVSMVGVAFASFTALAVSLNFSRLWHTDGGGESESKEPRGRSGSSVPEMRLCYVKSTR